MHVCLELGLPAMTCPHAGISHAAYNDNLTDHNTFTLENINIKSTQKFKNGVAMKIENSHVGWTKILIARRKKLIALFEKETRVNVKKILYSLCKKNAILYFFFILGGYVWPNW